ncbi:MAG: arginine--tRNA ligase, partial [Gammaproteobacteria bacterium]
MKEQIASKLADAVYRLQIAGRLPSEGLPEIMVERTRDRAHGDFASNYAMLLAKPVRRKPRELAEQLVAAIEPGTEISRIEIAGPGFINFHLGPAAWHGVVRAALEHGAGYGRSQRGAGQRVQVEFVSA